MKFNIVLIVSTLFIIGCSYDKRSKKHPPRVTVICNHSLYVETYNVFAEGGAVGGSMESDYLTDSTNFRVYIGTYDDADGGYSYECNGDSIKVFEIKGRSTGENKIINTTPYSLQNLKAKKKFE